MTAILPTSRVTTSVASLTLYYSIDDPFKYDAQPVPSVGDSPPRSHNRHGRRPGACAVLTAPCKRSTTDQRQCGRWVSAAAVCWCGQAGGMQAAMVGWRLVPDVGVISPRASLFPLGILRIKQGVPQESGPHAKGQGLGGGRPSLLRRGVGRAPVRVAVLRGDRVVVCAAPPRQSMCGRKEAMKQRVERVWVG